MTQKIFKGYHSEWNLGSPGGWDYERMAEEIGHMCWQKIKALTKTEIELDFKHPLLNPVPLFAELLMRAHKNVASSELPFIVLLAEEDTLDKVGENIRFVEYLNSLPDVKAKLAPPHHLELKQDKIYLEGERVTLIFMDFNNNVLVKLGKKHDIKPVLHAIRTGMVVNPRGMEPIGAKGVFETITGPLKNKLHRTTVERTPWTRQFYLRSTDGPKGESIKDLVQWTKENRENVILKPVHGYSGHGIFIGFKSEDWEKDLNYALECGGYIVQELIPLEEWSEDYPAIDYEKKELFIKTWQTDFRCFVTDAGLIGFVTRFGGVPTNVGSGGGVQSLAVLKSDMPVAEAAKRLNDLILDLGYDMICEIQEEVNKRAVEIGSVYLLGPIMTTLRPRLVTVRQMEALKEYAENLWKDAVTLEGLWRGGNLEKLVEISDEEAEVARMMPWEGKPALIASDGLFGFE